jgi:Pyruvate/2-oxoacid:ferredoxin oxidoreductase delta subunit
MCKTCLVVTSIKVYASGGLATTNGLGFASGSHIIVPSSVFLPSLAAALRVTQGGRGAFEHARTTSVIIHGNVRVLCLSCFSFCKSLSSISFECASELIRIEPYAFDSSLESITIPCLVQFIDGSACATISKILISITSDSSYVVIKWYFILGSFKATLNRYPGDASQISISHQIQVICASCVVYCESLSLVSFDLIRN